MTGAQHTATEKLFRAAITIKGIDGALQLVAGIVLIFVPGRVITELVHVVVSRDLLGSPGGPLATHLQLATHDFVEGSSRTFVVAYLLSHAVVKLGLVAALWRKIMPAYPVAVVVMTVFVVVELLRGVQTHSILLPVLAALDVLIILFVIKEYIQLRRERRADVLTG
jgi:uncharacterized membrane protein